jgi:hypothetical protein
VLPGAVKRIRSSRARRHDDTTTRRHDDTTTRRHDDTEMRNWATGSAAPVSNDAASLARPVASASGRQTVRNAESVADPPPHSRRCLRERARASIDAPLYQSQRTQRHRVIPTSPGVLVRAGREAAHRAGADPSDRSRGSRDAMLPVVGATYCSARQHPPSASDVTRRSSQYNTPPRQLKCQPESNTGTFGAVPD